MLKENIKNLVHSLWASGVNPYDAVKILKATDAKHEDIMEVLKEKSEELKNEQA